MSETPHQPIFLGRQPILGRDQQLQAYELLFRNGDPATGNRAEIDDPTRATATVIANAFAEISIDHALGPYRSFINVDHEFLFSELIEALPASHVVLELLENIPPSAEVMERCRQLRHTGFTLAIDDLTCFDEKDRAFLDLMDIIKIDIVRMDGEKLRTLVGQVGSLGKQLLAEKVETIEQFALCRNLGFSLFQGYFFARPTIIIGKKLSASQLALMRLLALVMEDAETSEIENAFKLEPGLTVNLLRLTNSVGSGLAVKVTSLRHAITLLGRKPLQRWLQLLMYTHPQTASTGTNPLLPLAATRGRLMELLAGHTPARSREFVEQAFMVGIMSLMPVLLGMPMSEIIDQLPIAARVRQALDGYGGAHGALLQLVESTEQSDPALIDEALARCSGITSELLEQSLGQAFCWANNLAQEKG